MDSLFPVHPRKRGVLFDLYVSNPDGPGRKQSAPRTQMRWRLGHRSGWARS